MTHPVEVHLPRHAGIVQRVPETRDRYVCPRRDLQQFQHAVPAIDHRAAARIPRHKKLRRSISQFIDNPRGHLAARRFEAVANRLNRPDSTPDRKLQNLRQRSKVPVEMVLPAAEVSAERCSSPPVY